MNGPGQRCGRLESNNSFDEAHDMKHLGLLLLAGLMQGCTVVAIADAAGSAVVYGAKTVVNTIDAITPDIVNKKKD